jgi:hypothetical protein
VISLQNLLFIGWAGSIINGIGVALSQGLNLAYTYQASIWYRPRLADAKERTGEARAAKRGDRDL